MSTIRDTVTETLRARGLTSYTSQAEPVVAALETREERIRNGLRDYARSRGLRDQEVSELFVRVGLEERPTPTPAPMGATAPTTPGDERSILDRLDALGRDIENIKNAANRHGVRI